MLAAMKAMDGLIHASAVSGVIMGTNCSGAYALDFGPCVKGRRDSGPKETMPFPLLAWWWKYYDCTPHRNDELCHWWARQSSSPT